MEPNARIIFPRDSLLVQSSSELDLSVIKELANIGLSLSVDDFGTGYSSLAYLRQFPIDIIKIDRSFIQDIPDSIDACAIVTAIIVLAHSLRLEVIAEGVETATQLRFLQEQQCDILQGYYLSKPVAAQDLTNEFLSKHHFVSENE